MIIELLLLALAGFEQVDNRPLHGGILRPIDSILYRDDVPWNGRFYSFGFKTTTGISRREKGQMKENQDGIKYLNVEGEYSYHMPDGMFFRVGYKADDNGYRATEDYVTNTEKYTSHADHTYDNTDYEYTDRAYNQESNNKAKLLNVDTEHEDGDRLVYFSEIDTTSTVSTTDCTQDNSTIVDYEELTNRISDVPPVVLASLLGG